MKTGVIQIGALIVTAAVLAVVALLLSQSATTFGASVGSSYQYKNYTASNASSTARTVVRGGGGELGTLTINGSTGSVIRLYDAATSTAATSTLTAIGVIQTTTSAVTLTYDIAFAQGLTIELPATFAGNITLSVR